MDEMKKNLTHKTLIKKTKHCNQQCEGSIMTGRNGKENHLTHKTLTGKP